MNAMKKVMALLLVFALAFACLPLGAVTAFATEMEEPQVPAKDVLATEVTEETTEPVTDPTEAPTEETESPTEPSTVTDNSGSPMSLLRMVDALPFMVASSRF